MKTTTLIVLASAGLLSTSALAENQYTSKNNLNHRPVDQIAQQLGIDGQQFADCFAQVSPARDFNPTPDLERNNKAKLLPCLQAANPAITNDQLDTVMNTYRGVHI